MADGECRSSTTALVWRIAGIGWDQFEAWKRRSPQAEAALREQLAKIAGFRSVPLPRNEHTDPSYTALCEEHEYGLYTVMAKKAREAAGIADFRQW